MIARIQGRLVEVEADQRQILVDVQGVGYAISVHQRDLAHLTSHQGESVTVYTSHVLRQDVSELYGFLSHLDRVVFRDAIQVNGVGAKMAMALLGHGDMSSIAQAVFTEDLSFFKHIPGVGPKLAKRIILELANTVKKWETSGSTVLSQPVDSDSDLLGALKNLGYRESEIQPFIHVLEKDTAFSQKDISDKIRTVLQKITPASY